MTSVTLKAQLRDVFGRRKVKKLRQQGIVPGHVFGHGVKTIAVQVAEKEFQKAEKIAGETGIVNLQIDSESRPVLIRSFQVDPVTDQVLHIDFYQVNLKEKVKVRVPVEVVGESPAVESKQGVLLTPLTEIEVEALPTDLPEAIKVDISKLEKLDDAILVKDLNVGDKVTILADPDETVVKIGELVTKETEEILAEEAAERAEAEEVEKGEAEEGEEKPTGEESPPPSSDSLTNS